LDVESFSDNIFRESCLEERLISEMKLESSCFLIQRDYLGPDDNALSHSLMKSLFYVMAEKETKPSDIILINRGVLLSLHDSPVLSALLELDRNGVSILCCGASLNHLKVRDELAIGFISNMYDILEVLMRSRKVITL